jgi:hypothetical protein
MIRREKGLWLHTTVQSIEISVTWFMFNRQRREHIFNTKHNTVSMHTISIDCMWGAYECELKYSNFLLGMVALCPWMRTSPLADHLLKINCPIFGPLARSSLPPFSPSRPHMRALMATDYITMHGSSSVRHSYRNTHTVQYRKRKRLNSGNNTYSIWRERVLITEIIHAIHEIVHTA